MWKSVASSFETFPLATKRGNGSDITVHAGPNDVVAVFADIPGPARGAGLLCIQCERNIARMNVLRPCNGLVESPGECKPSRHPYWDHGRGDAAEPAGQLAWTVALLIRAAWNEGNRISAF